MSYDDGIEQVIDESSVGVIEDSPNAVIIGKFGEGEIEGNIYSLSFGTLLLATFGSVSSTGPVETSVYTHSFTVDQSAQHDSLTIFLDDGNQDYKYALAMVQSLEIDVAVGQFSKFTASFRSKVGATATLTPSYTTESHFLPQHASLKTASSLAGLAAASAIDVRSVRLSISKNVEDDRKLGSVDQVDILNKQLSVEGSLELVFDSNTIKTDMLADTAKAMRLRLTNSDVTIGATKNPQLTIDLAKVKFSNFKKNYGNNDIVTATVDFKAFYSTTDTSMITAEMVNGQISY
jgi:hypothetical protein